MKKLSLIIPCYNEQDVILKTYDETTNAFKTLEEDYEIIFVNDGSKDNTIKILKELAIKDKKVKVIDFSRNFGQQAALAAGLDYADGDYVGFMDADLQDPPILFDEMLQKIKKDGFDVVYGTRKHRDGETKFKKFSSKCYYKILTSFSDTKMPIDTSDFRVMTKQVADEVRNLKEKNRYMRGLVSWVGFKQGAVYFDRPARYAGETKYSLHRMIGLALDGIYSFSYAPSKIPVFFSILAFILSFFVFLISLFNPLFANSFNGFYILFIGGLILSSIWIITQYAYRILHEVRNRPIYIIKEKFNF